MGLALSFSSWKRWECPSPHQLGKKNLRERVGGAQHRILHPAQPVSHRSPQGPGLGTVGQACPQGLYLILYTTTWLQDSSTVKRWLGGNQQLRSSVARAKSG